MRWPDSCVHCEIVRVRASCLINRHARSRLRRCWLYRSSVIRIDGCLRAKVRQLPISWLSAPSHQPTNVRSLNVSNPSRGVAGGMRLLASSDRACIGDGSRFARPRTFGGGRPQSGIQCCRGGSLRRLLRRAAATRTSAWALLQSEALADGTSPRTFSSTGPGDLNCVGFGA